MAQAREDRKEGLIEGLLKDPEIQAEVDGEEKEDLDEGVIQGRFSKDERIMRGLYILYEKVYSSYNKSKDPAKFNDCEIILELMRDLLGTKKVGEEWEGIIKDKEEELKKFVDGAVRELPLPSTITREIALMVRSKSKRKKKTKRSKSKGRKSKGSKSKGRKSKGSKSKRKKKKKRRKSKEVSL